jgi:hypothetical protein
MAIQDTSNAIFETTVHTQKNLGVLFEKVTSKTVGMYCPHFLWMDPCLTRNTRGPPGKDLRMAFTARPFFKL